jgi:hypothetical protein
MKVPDEFQQELEALQEKAEALEGELGTLRKRLEEAVSVDEMYEHVDEAVEGVEKALRKQDRRALSARTTDEARIAALEAIVEELRAERAMPSQTPYYPSSSPASRGLAAWIASWVPRWLVEETESYQKTRRPARQHSLSASGSPRGLETIPEDGGASPAASPKLARNRPSKSRSRFRLPFVNVVFRIGDLATLPIRVVLGYLLAPRSIASPYARAR